MNATYNNTFKEFKIHNHSEQRDMAALPVRTRLPSIGSRGPRRSYIWLAEEKTL